MDRETLVQGKQAGMSDKQIGAVLDATEDEIRSVRRKYNVLPWVKQVRANASPTRDVTPFMRLISIGPCPQQNLALL